MLWFLRMQPWINMGISIGSYLGGEMRYGPVIYTLERGINVSVPHPLKLVPWKHSHFLNMKKSSLVKLKIIHYPTLHELYHFSIVLCRGKRLLLTSRCCRWELFSLMTSAVTSSRVRWSSLWFAPSLTAGARSRSPPQEWSYTSQRWTGKKGSILLGISYGSHLTCVWENTGMVFPKSRIGCNCVYAWWCI